MTVFEVPAPVLHPAGGATAWVFFLIGIACAVVLSAGHLARLWRTDRARGEIRSRPTASASPYRNQGDERVAGG
jgi:hypothetical protein